MIEYVVTLSQTMVLHVHYDIRAHYENVKLKDFDTANHASMHLTDNTHVFVHVLGTVCAWTKTPELGTTHVYVHGLMIESLAYSDMHMSNIMVF